MKEQKIRLLETDDSKKRWRVSCHEMWQDIFGDSDAYLDYYMRYKWPVNMVFLLTEGDLPCSMLQLNPYRVCQDGGEQELHYIVGVSTREELRGRGYMGLLMRRALRYLHDRGEAWTYLMPAEEAIYKPFDFRPVSFARGMEDVFGLGGAGRQKPAGRIYPYGGCPAGKRRELADFAGRRLAEQFSIYTVHDEIYFREVSAELQACGGELLILEQEGEIIGYTAFMYEEPGLAEMAETVLADGKRRQAYCMLREYLPGYCGRNRLRTVFSESAFLFRPSGETAVPGGRLLEEKCQIMARILIFEEAARRFRRPEGWPELICCQITDTILEDNNGVWELRFGEGETQVRRTRENPSVSLDIGGFASLFFAQHPLYINDMV